MTVYRQRAPFPTLPFQTSRGLTFNYWRW